MKPFKSSSNKLVVARIQWQADIEPPLRRHTHAKVLKLIEAALYPMMANPS
jgi:hypothetical protein